MIKIVFVSPSTKGGGAERMQINIMHSLPMDKYEIYFINTGCDPKPAELKSNIHYLQYNKTHARNAFFNIQSDIKRIAPDYIFTTSIVLAYLLQIVRLTLKVRTKLFVRIAVPPSEAPNMNFKSKVLRKLNSITLGHTDLIIAQTEFSKTDVIKHYKVAPKKVKVIRNIVDKALLEVKGADFLPEIFDSSSYNIVASGALYSVKGFDLLIDAMKEVVEHKPNIKLFILGDERYEIGYRKQLEKQIANNQLEKFIFLLGHQNNPYPFYKNADLFVLSSRKEGYPNVVLENLFYGTPVVVTDCVDFSEVIDNGTNGYVVSKNSVTALSKGVLNAIDKLSKTTMKNIENFNYETIFVK